MLEMLRSIVFISSQKYMLFAFKNKGLPCQILKKDSVKQDVKYL